MDFWRLDLNLLLVFDAVMRERSVLRAGRQLHLTQSAVSHALNRLRHSLGDELFVRDTGGVRPTPRALEVAGPVAEALDTIRRSLSPPAFDPARVRCALTVVASDYVAVVVLPLFIATLRQEAPGIDVQIFPIGRTDLAAQLDSWRLDLAVSWFDHVPSRLFRTQILEEDEVLVVAKGHRLATGELTMQRLLQVPHLVVEFTGLGEGGDTGVVDERGLKRRTRIERGLTVHALRDGAAERTRTARRPDGAELLDGAGAGGQLRHGCDLAAAVRTTGGAALRPRPARTALRLPAGRGGSSLARTQPRQRNPSLDARAAAQSVERCSHVACDTKPDTCARHAMTSCGHGSERMPVTPSET